MKRRELPLLKQIERGTQGPIADAHLNILLELEVVFPDNAGEFSQSSHVNDGVACYSFIHLIVPIHCRCA